MTGLAIHPIGLRDVIALRRVSQLLVPLSYPEVAFATPNGGWLAALPLPLAHRYAYLAEASAPCGLAVARAESGDFRWVLESLGAADGLAEARCDLWAGLLSHTVASAGCAGAKRVHADAPLDGLVHEALVRAGFSAYARGTLMLAQGLHPAGAEEVPLRGQEPSDSWSIQHLYHQVTPKAVQYAEAFNSTHWQAGRRLRSSERGFLAERASGIVAYCRVFTSGRQMAIEVMALPDQLRLVPALVRQAVRAVGLGQSGHVWALVPDYHGEYVAELERIGFAPVDRRAQMVRYTGVPVAAAEHRLLSLVSNVAERLPSRVPAHPPAPAGTNIQL